MLGLKDMVIAKVAGGLAFVLAIAMVYVLISSAATGRALRRTINDQNTRIEQLTSDLTQCRANVATLDGAISRQNAAVEAMRREGAARVAELDRVAVRARQEAETANARARRIMGRTSTGDQCADARALILETVR